MYIEKLSKKDLMEIFTKLLLIVENGNADQVRDYLEESQITRGADHIEISFNTGYEIHKCLITDYTASVSYGYYTHEDMVKVSYRKHMYQKFGNDYYEDMRDYYKRIIFSKCDKQLEELSNDLSEMIK